MSRTLVLLAALVMVSGGSAEAQMVLSDTQGLSSVGGTGARALGMGGAFTALADDSTAVAWNPAGLALVERPELAVGFDWYEGDRVFEADWVGQFDPSRECGNPDPANPNPVTTGCREKQHHSRVSLLDDRDLAFVGGVYPLEIASRRVVGALSFRRLASFPHVEGSLIVDTRSYGADDGPLPGRTRDVVLHNDNVTGGVDAYSASFASAWGSLRLGLTLSYLDADMDQRFVVRDVPYELATHPREVELNGNYRYSAFKYDLGVQWQAFETVTFGLVYHSAFNADLDSNERVDLTCSPEVWGPACGVPTSLRHTARLRWPDGWAVGAAWQPTSRWTVALDYGQTNWSKAEVRGRQYPGWDADLNPVPVDLGTVAYPFEAFPYEQQQVDSWVARAGVEYTVSYLTAQIPLRLGYFREKQPALSTDFTRDANPPGAPTYTGVTAGVGVVYKSFQLDLAWVHAEAEQEYPIAVLTEDDLFQVSQRSDFSSDRFLASVTYRF